MRKLSRGYGNSRDKGAGIGICPGGDPSRLRAEGGRKKIRVPILKESNIGSRMAIDEKTINGVCYTIISNRETSKIALMADTLRTSELRQVLTRFR